MWAATSSSAFTCISCKLRRVQRSTPRISWAARYTHREVLRDKGCGPDSPGNPQRAVEPKVKPSRKPEDIMACQCSQIARASPAHPLHGSRFQVRPSNLQFCMSLPGGLDGSQGLFQVGRVGSYLAKVDFSLAAALKLDHSLVKSAGLPRG